MATRTRATAKTPPIKDLSAVKEHFNLMVYADSGVGKTPFSAGHPESLILAADNGTISAARWGGKAQVWEIPDWEEFEEALKWVRAGGFSNYKWIILDSFTMLREKCMRFTLESENAKNPSRDEFIPAQPDHQKVQNVMKRVAERLCDLPVSFLATALPMGAEDREGESRVIPMIHGQKGDTSHYIAGLFDCVGYMEKTENDAGKVIRRTHWEPYGEFIGKDRFGTLAPYTDDLTLPQIEKLLAGARPAATTPRAAGRPAGTRRRRSA